MAFTPKRGERERRWRRFAARPGDLRTCLGPSLFLGPLLHAFGRVMDDWARLGRGILVGHLLECLAQVSGGCYANPGFKDVPDQAAIGFPRAEVYESGNAVFRKLPGAGGRVSRGTCIEQLLYEIHEPARCLQPDVVADFSRLTFEGADPDRVAVPGGAVHPRKGC